MILTKDLDVARWAYSQSERNLGDAISNSEKALNHLKYIKTLHRKGFVNLKTYQSYKTTTAKHRQQLTEQIKQYKLKRHETWKVYDTLQIEYNKQNPENTLLQDTLNRLTEKQKQALKEYFSKTNL